jgi:hypothetical protein
MPAVSGPQGSRGGLITAVAIFTILFVVSTIFAIYYGVAASKVQDEFATYKKQQEAVARNPASPDITDLKNDHDFLPAGGAAIDVAKARTAALIKAINGVAVPTGEIIGTNAKQACDAAAQAVIDAQKTVGDKVTLPNTGDNLISVVQALATAVQTLQAQNDQLTKDKDAAIADSQAKVADAAAQVQAKSAEVEAANADKQKALDDEAAALADKDKQIDDIKAGMDDERKQYKDNLTKLQLALAESDAKATQSAKEAKSLSDKLAGRRYATEDSVISRPAGAIVRIADANTVFINLGQGDQITAGLTFEVYDKNEPLPKLGDGTSDDNMPVGKASIEVTRVGMTSSECRVIRTQPGETLTEGDPIINIVYDRNTKYNFVVFGDFDIDNTGQATPQQADVIKRLVTQWGGKLQTGVNADTDFLVLGKEPELPNYSKDDLQDPFNAKKLADATKALDDYDNIKQQAKDLHIPVMNQNRFLYFVGFYDLATR